MENLQLVLSVLGAVAIIAVLVHGFWSIRRQQPRSNKDTPTADLYSEKKRDHDGFDADGIGEVRVRKRNDDNETASEESQEDVIFSTDKTDEPVIDKEIDKKSFSLSDTPVKKTAKVRQEPSISAEESESVEQMELSLGQEAPQTSLFEDPVTNRKPEKVKPKVSQVKLSPEKTTESQSVAEVEFEIAEAIEDIPAEPVEQQKCTESQDVPLGEPKDVLVLHVVAKEGEELNGAELLPSLLTLNFKFGDMDIFHRHEDNAGTGKVLFSLANMVKPGVFNPDEMEQFTTQGVVLFMTIPCHGDPLMNFSNMLNSAHQIADDLGGKLLDGGRESWDEQKKQAYIQRIRANI